MIKRLSACFREYKRDAILSPTFVIFEVVLDVLIPLLMSILVDDGISPGNTRVIFGLGAALVLCAVLSLVFGVLSGRSAASAAAGFAKNLRHDMFHKIQDFSFRNIDKFSTSSLVTRLTTDVTNLQNAVQMALRIIVRSPAMLIFAMVMAFGINAELPMVFLFVAPLLGVWFFVLMTKAYPVFKQVFKIYDVLNKVVQENLRGIRVVKSYVREEHESGKFKKVSEDIYQKFSIAEKLMAFAGPGMQFCMYCCILLISWFGARLIVSDRMTTGQLMSMTSYAAQILMSLMLLSMAVVMLTISQASAARIAEVLDEEADIKNCENPVKFITDGSIRFENVDFSYAGMDGKLALKSLNLDIKSGQTIGILGGTGSGKSTLVQLIPRLYDVTGGKITVGGRDVRDYDLYALRGAVSMVLQKNELFSGTIKENLRWGNKNASDEELAHACKIARADGFIKNFPDGYDTHIEQGGSNVSGGQKQRLCIARALLKNPKILIFDDSTSAVDTKTDAEIREALAKEVPGTTKIIIAQRISSVEHADQIIVMDEGEINAVGSHKELLENNTIYREVYQSQVKRGATDEQ